MRVKDGRLELQTPETAELLSRVVETQGLILESPLNETAKLYKSDTGHAIEVLKSLAVIGACADGENPEYFDRNYANGEVGPADWIALEHYAAKGVDQLPHWEA